jgi:glycosyltransferase involved in cell wall biosynthesis
MVSRLRREKGIGDLIAALPQVQAQVSQAVHVVVAGDGPDKDELAELAAGQSVPVHFVGHRDDVAPWFAIGDTIAMPSHREGFPVSGVEAMSAGRPIVAAAVGGLWEVVEDGVTGYLVPPRQKDALAEGLVRLLRDPEATRRMGEAGKRRFERNFTNDAMVEGWLACFQDARQTRWAAR